MEREILFRGKRVDGGGWVEGSLLCWGDSVDICVKTLRDVMNKYRVDPATIGQFTGLTDKHGVKIFEGDILEKLCPVYRLGKPAGERMVTGTVIWDDESSLYPGFWALDTKDEYGNPTKIEFTSDFQVCGNIHDNPDLREGT